MKLFWKYQFSRYNALVTFELWRTSRFPRKVKMLFTKIEINLSSEPFFRIWTAFCRKYIILIKKIFQKYIYSLWIYLKLIFLNSYSDFRSFEKFKSGSWNNFLDIVENSILGNKLLEIYSNSLDPIMKQGWILIKFYNNNSKSLKIFQWSYFLILSNWLFIWNVIIKHYLLSNKFKRKLCILSSLYFF